MLILLFKLPITFIILLYLFTQERRISLCAPSYMWLVCSSSFHTYLISICTSLSSLAPPILINSISSSVNGKRRYKNGNAKNSSSVAAKAAGASLPAWPKRASIAARSPCRKRIRGLRPWLEPPPAVGDDVAAAGVGAAAIGDGVGAGAAAVQGHQELGAAGRRP